ncbi:MAG: RNA polymerase subunit sigma [Escherichia coli]|nr:MAG: RNA polymerase subunit sigma [Escherichia coli]
MSEHLIVKKVYDAKSDMQIADELIKEYMPFIKSETSKFLHRVPTYDDDELSISMIAFHEAIRSYSRTRGSFLKYASVIIKNRLIDYARKEQKQSGVLSIEMLGEERETSVENNMPDEKDEIAEYEMRDATKSEIVELVRQMEPFGVSLSDVADNCPKQQKTIKACADAIEYAKQHPELLDEFLRTKRLPMAELTKGSGAERKTLERHRKYLVALLLIYTNGYEIIRGHIKQVLKGGLIK